MKFKQFFIIINRFIFHIILIINRFIYLVISFVKSKAELLHEYLVLTSYSEYLEWGSKQNDRSLLSVTIERSLNWLFEHLIVGFAVTYLIYVYGLSEFCLSLIMANALAYWLLKVVVKTLKGDKK